MEEDRQQANVGADSTELTDSAAYPTPKQPKKRIIGRRAAAEKAATRGSEGDKGQDGTSDTLIAPRPSRPIRTLHQIPDSILHDDELNAAVAILPSNYNFEIHKTIHRIRQSGAKVIALQFPEGLLMFAPLISDIFTQFCHGIETIIMGDVTYGACCIDDFTARALGCDLLVHYGHSCLVPIDTTGKEGLKVIYVFVTIGIDVEHLITSIDKNFQSGKRIALVGTIQFNNTLHAILPRLKQLGYDPVLPRSNPLSAGEILGCTAPTLCCKSESRDEKNTADMILYVGDGRFHLESILISSPQLRAYTYRYDPYSRRLTHETYEHTDMHSLRRTAIRSARETLRPLRKHSGSNAGLDQPEQPRSWGLILGTLGRQGNPHTLDLITYHLAKRSIPYITILLSEVMPAKLALMSADVAVWVQVACPRLSIDWGYAFERPLLNPYEACIVLGIRAENQWAREEDETRSQKDSKADLRSTQDAMQRVQVASENARTSEAREKSEGVDDGNLLQVPAVYPMDYYEKNGLGRIRHEDIPVD